MPKFQISAESTPGSGNFSPVETFDASDILAVNPRVQVLQKTRPGAYIVAPYIDLTATVSAPVQASVEAAVLPSAAPVQAPST